MAVIARARTTSNRVRPGFDLIAAIEAPHDQLT
jgi:hypothetical protein